MAEIDAMVVDTISEKVLTPAALDWVIDHGVQEAGGAGIRKWYRAIWTCGGSVGKHTPV